MRLKELFNEDYTPNWDVFNKTFPEMTTCKHSLRWHKCGSPLKHTMLVTEAMADKLKDEPRDSHYIMMMSAAMLHDIGKPLTTYWDEREGDWCCKEHGAVGEKLFRNTFLEESLELREEVAYMIRYHMVLNNTPHKAEKRKESELKALLRGTVRFEYMLLLNECDKRGSINDETTEEHIKSHCKALRKEVTRLRTDKPAISKTKMYVMIGIPGSGKSTFAKGLMEMIPNLGIVSRDTVRIEMGLCKDGEKCIGNKGEEEEVSRRVKERVIEFAKSGQSFIIDNTSLKKKYRNQFKEWVKEYNVSPVFVYVEAPSIEEALQRRNGQIERGVIQKMWDSLEFPSRSECDELWLDDQHNSALCYL